MAAEATAVHRLHVLEHTESSTCVAQLETYQPGIKHWPAMQARLHDPPKHSVHRHDTEIIRQRNDLPQIVAALQRKNS